MQRHTSIVLRGGFTLVTFICDRTDLQPLMPQIIICNEQLLTKKDLEEINARSPSNVFVLRRPSGWVTGPVFAEILRLFVEVTKLLLDPALHILFLFDCCKAHLCEEAWQALESDRIHTIIIPAKLTWLLQPLDTHAFAKFKQQLRGVYQEWQVEHRRTDVKMPAFLEALFITIRRCFQGQAWAHAFEADGWSEDKTQVSKYILKQLKYDRVPELPHDFPDLDALKMLLPGNVSAARVSNYVFPAAPPQAPPPLPPPLQPPPPADVENASASMPGGPAAAGSSKRLRTKTHVELGA